MPVFEVFADDTIKSYRNNESKLEIDPENNRIRLRDNVSVSGSATISGDIIIPQDKYLYVEGDSDDALNRIGRNSSENALLLTSRFHAAMIIDSNADDTDSEFSVRHNGTTIAGSTSLFSVNAGGNSNFNGNLGVTGELRVDGNISTAGYLDVPASIRHVDDLNTSIDFAFDSIRLQVGGHDLFRVDEDDGNIVFSDSSSKSVDVRMESNSKTNMFFLDASEDKIGIGTTQPLADFEVHGIISGVKSYSQHARFEHRNNSHEDGGTSVLGYNTRAFNKTIVNNGGFVTTGANTFTLSQGLYWVVAETTQSAEGFIQLRNNSDSAFINHYRSSETLQSVNAKGSSSSDYVPHHLQGVFYLGSSKTIELQSFVADPRSNDGFGGPISDDTNVGPTDYTDDVYAWIEFWKISPTG